MKRRDLILLIESRIKELHLLSVVFSEGSSHSHYKIGEKKIQIPRHREIDENLARYIMKQLESELGERWWL
jgi:hypothetical protein